MNHEAVAVEKQEKSELGFWLYLMTDIMLFASLFATFIVLKNSTNMGVTGHDILEPGYALIETFVLLASSVTCGLALISARFKKRGQTLGFLLATIILGVTFLALELHEFAGLVADGNSWRASAFLSGFFTLVATHGLHILIGLIWASVLYFAMVRRGMETNAVRKFSLFALFWHFLDIVWIFIFSVVYLIGGLS